MSKDMGVAAGAAPFDDVAEAMAWLGMWSAENRGHMVPIHDAPKHVRTLQRLLAEPRLPHSPTNAMLYAMGSAAYGEHAPGPMGDAYRALYAHLTKPATKTVEVWRVEWAVKIGEEWHAQHRGEPSRAEAERYAEKVREPGSPVACIHVTGPHKQEVPA